MLKGIVIPAKAGIQANVMSALIQHSENPTELDSGRTHYEYPIQVPAAKQRPWMDRSDEL